MKICRHVQVTLLSAFVLAPALSADVPVPPRPRPPTPKPAPVTPPNDSKQPSVHVIQTGDTLTSIARKFGVTVAELQAANPGVNATRLQVGQKLTIPTRQQPNGPAAVSPIVPDGASSASPIVAPPSPPASPVKAPPQ